MLILLGIGYWANTKIKGMTDFLLAGRRLGVLLTAGALAATHFGGDSKNRSNPVRTFTKFPSFFRAGFLNQ